MSDDTEANTRDDATQPVEPPTAGAPTAAAPTNGVEKPASGKGKRWQRVTSVILLIVGFVLVPLSAVAIWTHNQLTNTDRYVETVGPLAGNQDIQQTVANAVVNAIFNNVNVEQRVKNALPERAQFLGAPIANAAQNYATDATEKLLASQQFQNLWDAANRRAHNQLVALLTDDPSKAPGAVSIENGTVSLDLGNVVKQVQGKLVDKGLTFLKNVKVPRSRSSTPKASRRRVSTSPSSTRCPGCSRSSESSRSRRPRSSCRTGAGRRSGPHWCSSRPACSCSCCSRSRARSTSTRQPPRRCRRAARRRCSTSWCGTSVTESSRSG
jgi:hypothetical protein